MNIIKKLCQAYKEQKARNVQESREYLKTQGYTNLQKATDQEILDTAGALRH